MEYLGQYLKHISGATNLIEVRATYFCANRAMIALLLSQQYFILLAFGSLSDNGLKYISEIILSTGEIVVIGKTARQEREPEIFIFSGKIKLCLTFH